VSVLIVRQEGPLKRLILNRPDKRNALNLELACAVLDAIEQAQKDSTRLLVLQGEGPVFCAGFDFSGLSRISEADLLLQFVRIEQMLQAVAHAPFDTLALAHGAAIGAGADLLVACRHRIGSSDLGARFSWCAFWPDSGFTPAGRMCRSGCRARPDWGGQQDRRSALAGNRPVDRLV